MLNIGDRHIFALDRDRLGLVHVAIGQTPHLGRERGREERGLAYGRRCAQDCLDVFDKTHAQHLVGLVQHDHVDLAQVEHLALHEIHEAARRPNDDVHTLIELANLGRIGRAAVDSEHTRAQVAAIFADRLGDLHGQLTRRRQHQRLHMIGAQRQVVEHGQGEGCGLAGTGFGLAGHILAGHEHGNDSRLNGGRLGIAEGVDCLHQLGMQLQTRKMIRHTDLLCA